MRFIALLPVRDEADIIGQCLDRLLLWADRIYVFDTGSIDETWEIVQDYASRETQIVAMCKRPVYFSETRLRGYMFDRARNEMRDGDWFARVDADEFHHLLPPDFVRTHLRRHETAVYHQYYNFCLLESEVRDWFDGKEGLRDRMRPIEARRRHYLPSVYSEPRLCRYRSSMQWPIDCSFPVNAGFVARERIPIRHYPHRDPVQLERRCKLRAVMMADSTNRQNWSRPERHHWSVDAWREFVVQDDHPDLTVWQPGRELPHLTFRNHLRPTLVRAIQRIVHACFLPALDRTRNEFPADSTPQEIPAHLQTRLSVELAEVTTKVP